MPFLGGMVPRRGLEPPRLAALVPETSASTNSAIWRGAAMSKSGRPSCQTLREFATNSGHNARRNGAKEACHAGGNDGTGCGVSDEAGAGAVLRRGGALAWAERQYHGGSALDCGRRDPRIYSIAG